MSRRHSAHPLPVCDYEGSDYQAEFWEAGKREYEDRSEAIALGRLLPAGGDYLLEVGAGAGRNTPRYRGFERVALLDYSRSQLEQARRRLGDDPRFLYVVGDAYRLPFSARAFDAATMIRTLHHMVDPLRALRKIRGVLQSGTPLILEYPNKRNLKAIVRWLSRRQLWSPFDRRAVEFARLHFDFHPAAVRSWLELAGFRVGRQLTVSHFRSTILKQLVPVGMLVAADSAAQWTGGVVQLSPSAFIRAEAAGEDEDAPGGGFWRCPACESFDVRSAGDRVTCRACARVWVRREGIWDFKTPLAGARAARPREAKAPSGPAGRRRSPG
jgi:ubiquinone/menaquinone biosynthesis C-methylase UbiE